MPGGQYYICLGWMDSESQWWGEVARSRAPDGTHVCFPRSGADSAHFPARHYCADAAGVERARCLAAKSRCGALEVSGPTYGEPSSKARAASRPSVVIERLKRVDLPTESHLARNI